jgi:isoleucyl-tRNA synthetase
LLSNNKFKHSYPHCWRTKTPLIYRATPQWFISMNKNNLLEKHFEKLPDVNWIPAWGEARIQGMLTEGQTGVFQDKENGVSPLQC